MNNDTSSASFSLSDTDQSSVDMYPEAYSSTNEVAESPESQGLDESPESQGLDESPESQGLNESPESQGLDESPEYNEEPEVAESPESQGLAEVTETPARPNTPQVPQLPVIEQVPGAPKCHGDDCFRLMGVHIFTEVQEPQMQAAPEQPDFSEEPQMETAPEQPDFSEEPEMEDDITSDIFDESEDTEEEEEEDTDSDVTVEPETRDPIESFKQINALDETFIDILVEHNFINTPIHHPTLDQFVYFCAEYRGSRSPRLLKVIQWMRHQLTPEECRVLQRPTPGSFIDSIKTQHNLVFSCAQNY